MLLTSPAEKAFAVSADNLFEGADVTYTTDEASFEYSGQPAPMGVVSIVDATGEVYTPGADFSTADVDYTVRYFVDSNHNKKLDEGDSRLNVADNEGGKVAPIEVGNYFIVAMNETGYNNMKTGNMKTFVEGAGYVAKYFEVTHASLADAEAVNVVDADEGTYVEGFTYDAAKQNVGFVVDGKLLEEGKDYTVSFSDDPINAGEYTAALTGKGAYEGSTANVKFTIDKLDLSTAAIYAKTYKAGNNTSARFIDEVVVNGDTALSAVATWDQTRYYGADGKVYGSTDRPGYKELSSTKVDVAKGGYEFHAVPVNGADDKNVVGEAYVTLNFVDEVVAADDFLYDGVVMNDGEEDVAEGELNGSVLDQSKGEAYDASLFSIAGKKDVDFTVTPSTEEGNTVGAHTAVVEVTVPSDYSIGGSSQATYGVIAGLVDTAEMDAIAIIDGVNVPFGTTKKVIYDGEAVAPSITVSCGDKTLVAGTDYTVTYTDATGKAVDEMVNAGTYTVTLASDTYQIKGEPSFTLVIGKRSIAVAIDTNAESAQGEPGILYTGSAIEPTFTGTYTVEGEDRYVELDPSWYLLSGLQFMAPNADGYVPASAIQEVGDYKVNVSPTAECINYTWDAENGVKVSVIDTAYFTDVAADAWYSEAVYKAASADLKYMTGIAGTKLFMPENSINRAELAQVLFNMAGQARDLDKSYPTQFPDVDANAWYAQAIAWASTAGVVTGYEETGTFGPFDNATREAIATMLFRYAAAQGMDVSQRADLSAYTDASSVSPWAQDAVEWAVAEGIMGVDVTVLDPQGDAQRAQVAAMSVRLQPVAPETAGDRH